MDGFIRAYSNASAGYALNGFRGIMRYLPNDFSMILSLDPRFTSLFSQSLAAKGMSGRILFQEYPMRKVPDHPFGDLGGISLEFGLEEFFSRHFRTPLSQSNEFTPLIGYDLVANPLEVAFFEKQIEQACLEHGANLLVLTCHTKGKSEQGGDHLRQRRIGYSETCDLRVVVEVVVQISQKFNFTPLLINMQYNPPSKGGVNGLIDDFLSLRQSWSGEGTCPEMLFLDGLDLWDGTISSHIAVITALQNVATRHPSIHLTKIGNGSSLDHYIMGSGGLLDTGLMMILADSTAWAGHDRDRRPFWLECAAAYDQIRVIQQTVPGNFGSSIDPAVSALTEHFTRILSTDEAAAV